MPTLTGTPASERLQAATSEDVLVGLGGNDTLAGGIAGYMDSPAGVSVDLAAGTARDGYGSTDTLQQVEKAYGSAFNDTLVGDSQGNYLSGGAGDDSVNGGAGFNVLAGWGGNDTLTGGADGDILQPGDGNDVVNGGGGIDMVDYTTTSVAVTVDLYAGAWKGSWQDQLQGIQNITGSAFDDVLQGDWQHNTIMGGAGDDTIDGRDGGDYLRGEDGNDKILGGSGFDDINGNKGNDTIDGGAGGGDWLVGGQGDDQINSHHSDDILYGNLGNDTLNGGDGNEIIRGGQGDDVVAGGAGNDWLSGDRGNDTVTGGAGRDTFHSFSGAGMDVVTDFSQAEGDRVQLDPGTTYALRQSGADTLVDMGNGDEMVLRNVQLSSLANGWIFVG